MTTSNAAGSIPPEPDQRSDREAGPITVFAKYRYHAVAYYSAGDAKMNPDEEQRGQDLARLKSRAEQRIVAPVKVVTIQEVGLDGFWIHRLLEANGVESHVVDPASIAVPRRHRRAKTDAIDGETLLRTLMAWQRGEPRVCAMTVPPSPSEEDCRRVSRERATLLRERIQHTNRIRGLLFGQGITNYNPLLNALPPTRCAIYCCPRGPRGPSCPSQPPGIRGMSAKGSANGA
jgi:transposase